MATARRIGAATGARVTVTDDVAAVKGVDFVHTDIWVSMGEPKEVWAERIELLTPYRVTTELLERTENPDVKFMHCLPSYHDLDTTVSQQILAGHRTSGGVRGDRGGVRVAGVAGVRPGREPAAHDQGDPGGDAGLSTTVDVLSRPRPRSPITALELPRPVPCAGQYCSRKALP